MTAEIAILNKSAVALAADSAVTISAGSKEEKIFDSADKLFELSNVNSIGIMIYNGMSFAEIPLQSLIKKFRLRNVIFDKVKDAAESFLDFLSTVGADASKEIRDNITKTLLVPLLQQTLDSYSKSFQDKITTSSAASLKTRKDVLDLMHEILRDEIKIRINIFKNLPEAKFRGNGTIELGTYIASITAESIKSMFKFAETALRKEIVEMCVFALKSSFMSDGFTGIVVAGFGKSEMFPTLCCFEIDGTVCGQLKYIDMQHIDIDRSGPKATVVPFAQKEMVERFLYGLDEGIEKNVAGFCEKTIPSIRHHIMSRLSFVNDAEKGALESEILKAENAFACNLQEKAFEAIRSQSRAAIEDMVEFMPKPELAKMAEALVNLTSIKRRVSRGMETVGGPIDVAIISQSEGFVWVKRKHYFPVELNSRYFERVRAQTAESRESRNDQDAQHRSHGSARTGQARWQRPRSRSFKKPSDSG